MAGGTSSQIRRNSDGGTGLTTDSARMTAEGRFGVGVINLAHLIGLSGVQNGDVLSSVSTRGPRQEERGREQQAIAKGAFQINVAQGSATVKEPQSGCCASAKNTHRGITTAKILLRKSHRRENCGR